MGSREAEFARRLAANDKKTRDKSVKKLRTWLYYRSSQPSGFSEADMLKLWKGLFYCMWMSDKPLVQEELADNIATLIHSFSRTEFAFKFIETFFVTMQREWEGLDRLRLDKFYMFIRTFLRECFQLLKTNKWSKSVVEEFASVVDRGPLDCTDALRADGIQIHVIEKFVPELVSVSDDKLSPECLNILLQPLCLFAGRIDKFGDVMRFVQSVLEPLLGMPSVHQQHAVDETLKVDHGKLGELLFSVASNQKTKGKNRRKLFEMKRRFMARNEQSIKDATDLNPKGTNLETKDHVMVNGDMAGKQETFMDSGDCQMSVDDESLECREKRVNKKKRKGTPFSRTEGNRKENDGESLAEGTENSSILSNSSTDSIITFNFDNHLQSPAMSPSSALISTPKQKLSFTDTNDSVETVEDPESEVETSQWFAERVKRARDQWKRKRKAGIQDRRVYGLTSWRRHRLRAKKRRTVGDRDENREEQHGVIVDSQEVKAKRKKRVSFAQTEVQVQNFMQNMFLSSCPRYDGSQMPKKGVLKTSPLPPARDLSSSDHPVSSKMALSVKGRRTKAVDWVVI